MNTAQDLALILATGAVSMKFVCSPYLPVTVWVFSMGFLQVLEFLPHSKEVNWLR